MLLCCCAADTIPHSGTRGLTVDLHSASLGVSSAARGIVINIACSCLFIISSLYIALLLCIATPLYRLLFIIRESTAVLVDGED